MTIDKVSTKSSQNTKDKVSYKIVNDDNHQKKVERSLSASIHEGLLNAAASSIFSTFLVPLALELKASNLQIGLLNTAQNIASTVGQIPGAKMTAYYSRKGIWTLSQLMGRVFFLLPIIFLPFLNLQDPITVLIIFAALISFFLALRGPAWSSLMGDLVPTERRGAYFGRRNTMTGIASVAATLIAGFVVVSTGISLLFIVVVVMCIVSIPIFLRMYEPSTKRVFHYKHSFAIYPREWITAIKLNMKLATFTTYITLFYFATEISAPYYVVFMLKNLSISYEVFGILMVLGAIARIFSYKYWGYFNDKFGSRNILIVTGFFACFSPFGWMLSSSVWHVAIIKIFDGFIWAGFDQVVFNYLLDVTPADKRPQYVANHNFFTGIGVILGALVGGILAQSLGGTAFFWLVGLQIVFLLSFVLRLAVSIMLIKIRSIDVKQTDIMPVRYVFWQTMAVEPVTGVKNVIEYTFRFPFNREAEYVRAVQKLRRKEKLLKKKDAIIEGTDELFKTNQNDKNKKDDKTK